MRYFGPNTESIAYMLDTIGANSIDDLFSSIPKTARLKAPLKLPKPLDERGIKRALRRFSATPDFVNFLGAGATEHFVPEWVSQQILRAEWYTSYTPYQAEASQGLLQAIFEFQSMVAGIFGLDLANASMYDGATALTEAILLAMRVTKKKTAVIAKTMHPEYRQTARTYLELADLNLVEIDINSDGTVDLSCLRTVLEEKKNDIAAIAIQSPNFFGLIEDLSPIKSLARDYSALLITASTDISANAILHSPGKLGADVAIGEGLGFLGGINLGGPGVGLFAAREEFLRQLPGRLVGQTTDRRGQPGYVLTLSTREQHIRREKATSNICTNHNLMALALAMTLSAYGKSGFRKLATTNIKKTLFFRRCLEENGIVPKFTGPFYNETVIQFKDERTLNDRCRRAEAEGYIAGLPLARFYENLSTCILVATTELHSDHDLKILAAIFAGAHDD